MVGKYKYVLSLHLFSNLHDLPVKYSFFKCKFYVTRTAKSSKRKQTVKRQFVTGD